MSKWTKEQFVEDMRNKCSREIAKIGEKIIEFSDAHASEVTWEGEMVVVHSHFVLILM